MTVLHQGWCLCLFLQINAEQSALARGGRRDRSGICWEKSRHAASLCFTGTLKSVSSSNNRGLDVELLSLRVMLFAIESILNYTCQFQVNLKGMLSDRFSTSSASVL